MTDAHTLRALLLNNLPDLPRASCKTHSDPDAWFASPGDHARLGEAVRVCIACPERVACLSHAIDKGETHGVWGGTLPWQRQALQHVA